MYPILEIENLHHSFHCMSGETTAIDHISFSMEPGEFVSIVGPSGCGKSTLLSIISGLYPAEQGSVKIRGREVKNAATTVGYMLQHDELFEWRSIYHNVVLGLEIQHMMTAETTARANELLDIYGLDSFKDAKPSQLSGGMRQRAALIRTLVLEPDILLLDEPFSALDYQTRLKVSDDIGTIIRKQNKTAILVTHDLSEAISMGDRVIVLTKRPSSIKQTIALHFPDDSNTPLARRNTPAFKGYFNQLWKELEDNESE